MREAIAKQAMAKLSQFVSVDLSSFLWAFATRSVPNEPLLAALASASLPLISEFSPRNLAMMASSFSNLNVSHMPLREAIAA